ncbi:hypothetical protein B0T16DRAFT_400790 [Cercophora newfieldiana]|uniref:Uncharacterized protein n=1 Tax=Cercophora newfieldiana TaxID=92897 RepID=A0AA39YR00_9PEZI|nr:hypothetical protein B0T16DRAFT_400790 [Cercophora newfieldiana]
MISHTSGSPRHSLPLPPRSSSRPLGPPSRSYISQRQHHRPTDRPNTRYRDARVSSTSHSIHAPHASQPSRARNPMPERRYGTHLHPYPKAESHPAKGVAHLTPTHRSRCQRNRTFAPPSHGVPQIYYAHPIVQRECFPTIHPTDMPHRCKQAGLLALFRPSLWCSNERYAGVTGHRNPAVASEAVSARSSWLPR